MTQAREVLIYGASGYTGKLVAEYLATRNIPFYMAGRTRSRLETALDVVKQRVGGHVDAQIVTAKNGKRPQQSTGVMMFSRPGKFRWQIERPYSQLLVGDGEKVWIYDPDLRQVTVKKMGAALGSSLVVRRRIDRLDMVAALKTRE